MTTDKDNKSIDLFSIDKLMQQARQLAARYRQTTGNTLPVTAELARFDAAKLLGLDLNEDMTVGYDAIGKDQCQGKKYLIKGRVLFEESQSSPRIGQLNPDGHWDLIVLVLFDDHYNPVEIYQTSKEEVARVLVDKMAKNSKKRGVMSIAQFKIIADLVWTLEDGLMPDLWDNQKD